MAARPVIEKAPASSIVYCSQYKMEDYEQQNGSLPRHDKARVGSWLCDVQAAYASDESSPTRRRPAPSVKRNTSRTRSMAVTVRADAAGDRRHLLASRTGTYTCKRTTRAGFHFVAM